MPHCCSTETIQEYMWYKVDTVDYGADIPAPHLAASKNRSRACVPIRSIWARLGMFLAPCNMYRIWRIGIRGLSDVLYIYVRNGVPLFGRYDTAAVQTLPRLPSVRPLPYHCACPVFESVEILLVTWGICFIATREQAPSEKGRDFSQPLQKRRSSLQPTVCSDSECYGEGERPHWEPSARARRHGPVPGGSSIRSIPSVNGGSVGGAPPSVNDSSAGGAARHQVR